MQGNADGLSALGALYMSGRGVRKSDEKAYELFSAAAEKGDPLSMYNMGLMLIYGEGVEKSEEKGFEWISKAAGLSFPEAEENLAMMYAERWHMERSEQMAMELRVKAYIHRWIREDRLPHAPRSGSRSPSYRHSAHG